MLSKILSKNVIAFTAIFTLQFFIIVNIFYYIFNGTNMFTPFHYYQWVEYALGTAVMGICVFIIEALRSVLSKDS